MQNGAMNVLRACPEFYQFFNVVHVFLNQNAELFKIDFKITPVVQELKIEIKYMFSNQYFMFFWNAYLKYKTPASDLPIDIFSTMHKVLGSVPNN